MSERVNELFLFDVYVAIVKLKMINELKIRQTYFLKKLLFVFFRGMSGENKPKYIIRINPS